MLNDIRALCNVDEPHLVQFIGAYHAPENGQVDVLALSWTFACHTPGYHRSLLL